MSSCMYGESLGWLLPQPYPPTSVVHHGMPDSDAWTPCGTMAASSSNVDQISDDHSTMPYLRFEQQDVCEEVYHTWNSPQCDTATVHTGHTRARTRAHHATCTHTTTQGTFTQNAEYTGYIVQHTRPLAARPRATRQQKRCDISGLGDGL
eukprot:m.203925 g.203925  ORF g.203925 m.203925 type:complete len:150 (-) comp18865_c0_seq7:1719-2168(-)